MWLTLTAIFVKPVLKSGRVVFHSMVSTPTDDIALLNNNNADISGTATFSFVFFVV